MASKTLGRVVCPIGCGHNAAQVKVKTDKATGPAFPYVHCAGCGIQLHTRNDEQAAHLLKITRAEKGAEPAPTDEKQPPGDERAPVDTPPAPEPKKARSGWLMPGFGVPA